MTGVIIAGVGMMSAVGLSAFETAASVRAATMKFTEIDIRDRHFEAFTVAEVPEDGLPPLSDDVACEHGLSAREVRLLRLGTMPLLECLKFVKSPPKPALMLALPEMETSRPIDRPKLLALLARQVGDAFDLAASNATFTGRAGGLLAIAAACNVIRSGNAAMVVAGGIDTYRDTYILATLDRDRRVKSASNLEGFIPGEAAGFVLLASPTAAQASGIRPAATLLGCAEGFEPGHIFSTQPHLGEGLAGALRALLQSCALPDRIREVYSSMNGERFWAKEWGVAYTRNTAAFDPQHGMHHPADCFGDTAAACGPLLVGLAIIGMQKGYCRSPALLYCSSDAGPVAVAAVASA